MADMLVKLYNIPGSYRQLPKIFSGRWQCWKMKEKREY